MAGTGRLDGRTAVVTGGCSGIGLATVRRFAEEGAHVVIGDLDDARGPGVAEEVGGRYVHCDVTDAAQVDSMFATAHATYGTVDVAFNNAGISPPDDDSILDTGIDAWRKVQEVNLTSVYLCCKAVIPYMQQQRRGSIINTASFVAVMGAATSQISYTASKGGVLAMSRELGRAVRPRGHPGQRPLPGPGQHTAAARAVREGPGARGSPARARAAGPLRRARGDRCGGGVPRERRLELHHRLAVPRRRWHRRRLRDAAVSRPVIGITSYVEPASWSVWTDVPAALVPHGYVRHVHEAGGLAVVVPPLPDDATDDDARTVLSRLDGLILAGGVDVEPGRYGQEPHETVQLPRPDRDASELRLANVTAADDFPVLGICRGMQVMAVAAGGSLEQHLPERLGHHGHSPVARYVRRAPGRALARQPAEPHPRRPGHGRDLPPPGRRSRHPATPPPAGRTTASWRRSRTRVRGSGSRCSGTRRSASTRGCSRPWSRPAGPATETSYDV